MAQAETQFVLALHALSTRFFLEYWETTPVGEVLSWEFPEFAKVDTGPKNRGRPRFVEGTQPPFLVTYEQIPCLAGMYL